MYVGMYVCSVQKCIGGITYAHARILSFVWTSILFKVVKGLKHVLILRGVNILLMHSETFLTYGMTIVHLGVSLSFFYPLFS